MAEIYLTKFALKSGIHRVSADIDATGKATVQGAYPWLTTTFTKTDYALDEQAAKDRARAMALTKANKLEREAADLRAKFNGGEPSE